MSKKPKNIKGIKLKEVNLDKTYKKIIQKYRQVDVAFV